MCLRHWDRPSLGIRAEAGGQCSGPGSGFSSLCLLLEPRAGVPYRLHVRMVILSTGLQVRNLLSARKARASHCTHSQMLLSPGKCRSQGQALSSGLKSKDRIDDFFWGTSSRESAGSKISQKTAPQSRPQSNQPCGHEEDG